MSPSRTSMVLAGAAASSLLPATAPLKAQDSWPCEVLLCVSNPGGMLQFKECVAPIRRLITHLAIGKNFPTCTGRGTRAVKYHKPKNGQNGSVHIIFDDGRRQTYVIPLASAFPPPEPSPGSGGVEPVR